MQRKMESGGSLEQLRLSGELYRALPKEVSSKLGRLQSLEATANFKYHASGNAETSIPKFSINGMLSNGQYNGDRLLRPITNMTGKVQIDNETINISSLKANYGDTQLTVSVASSRL